jgi:soluble lytic murein transglycosylase-like protein
MTDELSVPAAGDRGLGLRRDRERRQGERRGTDRGARDRRRSVRRRATFRSMLFALMALSVPQLKHSSLAFRSAGLAPGARVSTSIDKAIALPPWRAYDGLIHEAAALYRVSPTLIHSVMQAESAFDPLALSRAGAMGLMQLMPEIVAAFGIGDPFDPRENIMGGTRLLRELLDTYPHNIPFVLAAYNAGPAAVVRYGRVPPFRETQGYVKKIVTLIADAHNAGGD